MLEISPVNSKAQIVDSDLVQSDWRDYFELLKPRVMYLVIFTGLVGMIVAPGDIHFITGLISILAIAFGAGAAGAINMWYDSDIDLVMLRTKNRPIPSGKVPKEEALTLGVVVGSASLLMMGLFVNIFSALILLFTIFFYVFIYTMWLKRRTSQNIVIGGAAGALPPVIGWVSVSGSLDVLPIVLFGIIFIWTPPHFWALSLYRHEDYLKANIPMLTIIKGTAYTRLNIFLYTILLVPITFIPILFMGFDYIYGFAALVLNIGFLYLAYKVFKDDDSSEKSNNYKHSKVLFKYSIAYLFFIFLSLAVDSKVSNLTFFS